MQFPSVSCSSREDGSVEQSSDAYYGRLLGIVKKDNKLLLQNDGCGRCVHFNTLPLPFTPPNTRTPYDVNRVTPPDEVLPPGRKFNFSHQLLYFYSNHTDVQLPVSVAAKLLPPTRTTISKDCEFPKMQRSKARPRPPSYPMFAESARPTDTLSCSSIVAHIDNLLLWACGPGQRTLGVARLSPHSTPTHKLSDSFLHWSKSSSPLLFHPLQALNMPAQVRDIQTTRIREKCYVCVRCDHHLCVLLVSGEGLETLRVHQTQHLILLSTLSPYVSEECVVLTREEGLHIVSKMTKITPLSTSLHPQAMCYSAHPRSLIVAVDTKAYKLDWRTSPISTCVLFEAVNRITCLSRDNSNPFVVFMCTKSRLIAVDIRERCRPLLSVLLEIYEPPFFISSSSSTQETLLMLASWRECIIVGVSKSPPLRTTLKPHLVMNLKAMHGRLMTSQDTPCAGKLYHVIYRVTRPLLGATLWYTEGGTYTSVTVTDLGDVFHQSWSYRDQPSSVPPTLDSLSYQGYNLWLEEAFAQEKELAEYRELLCTGGLGFSKSAPNHWIIDYAYALDPLPFQLCLYCHLKCTVISVEDAVAPLNSPTIDPNYLCPSCQCVLAPGPGDSSCKEEEKEHKNNSKSSLEMLQPLASKATPTLSCAWTD